MQRKRGPEKQLARRLREMVGLVAQIWVCMLRIIYLEMYH